MRPLYTFQLPKLPSEKVKVQIEEDISFYITCSNIPSKEFKCISMLHLYIAVCVTGQPSCEINERLGLQPHA